MKNHSGVELSSSASTQAKPSLKLGLIAGSGDFPILVAKAAKGQGVQQVVAVGFQSQTDPRSEEHTS